MCLVPTEEGRLAAAGEARARLVISVPARRDHPLPPPTPALASLCAAAAASIGNQAQAHRLSRAERNRREAEEACTEDAFLWFLRLRFLQVVLLFSLLAAVAQRERRNESEARSLTSHFLSPFADCLAAAIIGCARRLPPRGSFS